MLAKCVAIITLVSIVILVVVVVVVLIFVGVALNAPTQVGR